jgi:pimeloyl-ACP methyl ester carboxylesterase
MLILISVLVASILIITAILLLMSPGKPEPLRDAEGRLIEGAISEKIRVSINGVEQGMFISSKDTTRPVLLFLHGGMPMYFLTDRYPSRLEEYFTVVWWEQRGAGLSFRADIPAGSITLEQLISDTREVTNYLRERFGKEKIYLMGHSGGTFPGMHAAAHDPQLYHAYIGVAQISDQLKSEQLAYEYMLQQYRERGGRRMVRKLEAVPFPVNGGIPDEYLSLRDKAMHSLGVGTVRDMKSVITGIFFPSLTCRAYTLKEKINMWRGKMRTGVSSLWDTILVTDMTTQLTELSIPVYFFHGADDYTVSYALARDYFGKIKAPLKGFYTFEESAHSPLFEEPEKSGLIIREDILNGRILHSDSNSKLIF